MNNSAAGKVLVISTGGTIASRHDAGRNALISVASGAELLMSLGSLAPDQEILLHEFSNIGSNLIDLPMSLRLARRIGNSLADEAILGCVVTHGTDTLEESAFLAQLVVSSDKPVVFTGAQRGADQPDADGPRNLADALRVAADPSAAGLGVMVVFDGKVLSAVDATKVHASRTMGFDSSGLGPLGEVDNGSVLIGRRPPSYPRPGGDDIETRVDLLSLTMGADERLFEAAIASGAKGIVLEGFGRGNATPKIVDAVSRATARNIPTIVTSRCPQGRVLPLYAEGGGRDLEEAGAILAGRLQGRKARILLSLALANGYRDDVAELCEQFGG